MYYIAQSNALAVFPNEYLFDHHRASANSKTMLLMHFKALGSGVVYPRHHLLLTRSQIGTRRGDNGPSQSDPSCGHLLPFQTITFRITQPARSHTLLPLKGQSSFCTFICLAYTAQRTPPSLRGSPLRELELAVILSWSYRRAL